MKTENERPRLPENGEYVRGHGRLIAVQDTITPLPPPPTRDWIFEEITARTELRHNGERLKEMGTLWDFHGLEDSVKTAIKEAKEYAAKRNLGAHSELEVVVVRIASQVRKHVRSEANYYDRNFPDFEQLKVSSRRDLPDDSETVVWSSKSPDAKPCNDRDQRRG